MKGYIHSIESFSTLDGPGIRSVVFFQGCPLRCLYCHNPDTWIMKNGLLVDTDDILRRISKNLNYIKKDGGITISGGEPTLQIEFLAELLKKFKTMELHTAVDTSGYVSIEDTDKIVEYTDLFIVDIKHMDPVSCKALTGKSNNKTFKLLEYLNYLGKDVWIRNVLVPGFTDNDEHISKLCNYIKKFDNIKRLELLPYHDMGKEKYKKLGIRYKLEHVKAYDYTEFENIKFKFLKYCDGIAIV